MCAVCGLLLPPPAHCDDQSERTDRGLTQLPSNTGCQIDDALRASGQQRHEVEAVGLLRLLNECWELAEVQVCGVPVVAHVNMHTCGDEPSSVSLGQLKRSFTGDAAFRVTAHLGYDPQRLAVLAASTAAFLASNYILGAAAGDGDNVMLSDDGAIFRVDFGYLFGGRPAIAGMVHFDAPVVWLPRAVTVALAERLPDVQQAALTAFRVAKAMWDPFPPAQRELLAPWARAQAELFNIEFVLQLPVEHYVASLNESDFESAIQTADSSFLKKVKTFLHDSFGYRSRRCEPFPPACPSYTASKCEAGGSSALEMAMSWSGQPDAWRVLVCLLSCLCFNVENGIRVLRNLVWLFLVAAARSDDPALCERISHAVAAMVVHKPSELKRWLAMATSCPEHLLCLETIAQRLAEEAVFDFGPPTIRSPSALEAGLLCASARVGLSASSRPEGAVQSREFAACAVQARQFEGARRLRALDEACMIRGGSAQAVLWLWAMEESATRTLVHKLVAAGLGGGQLVEAARDLSVEEKFGSVRTAEAALRASDQNPAVLELCRNCLAAWARDEDHGVGRSAVCAIACAVDSEDEGVRTWARDYLKDAAEQGGDECSPVVAYVRLTRPSLSSPPQDFR